MVKCCVFFAVRTEFLNIIQTSFGFKGLREWCCFLRQAGKQAWRGAGWRGGADGRRRNWDEGSAVARQPQPRTATRINRPPRNYHTWTLLGVSTLLLVVLVYELRQYYLTSAGKYPQILMLVYILRRFCWFYYFLQVIFSKVNTLDETFVFYLLMNLGCLSNFPSGKYPLKGTDAGDTCCYTRGVSLLYYKYPHPIDLSELRWYRTTHSQWTGSADCTVC
jgi:hypothetical protein